MRPAACGAHRHGGEGWPHPRDVHVRGRQGSRAISALASMTTRSVASSGGSAFKLGASLADQFYRSRAELHPRPQRLDASERRERARPVVASGGQVVTQDALSGAVDVLVMTRGVLGEPLERSALKSYRPGHRRHEQSLSAPHEPPTRLSAPPVPGAVSYGLPLTMVRSREPEIALILARHDAPLPRSPNACVDPSTADPVKDVNGIIRLTPKVDRDSRRSPWADRRDANVADMDLRLSRVRSATRDLSDRRPLAARRLSPSQGRGRQRQAKQTHWHQEHRPTDCALPDREPCRDRTKSPHKRSSTIPAS